VLVDQFRLFSNMGRPALPVVERGLGQGLQLAPEKYTMPIEDLNLSMRAYNCLRRSGLMTVAQVLEKSEDELLALRNFGRKSYDELREKLDELGLLPLDRGDEAPPEALPLGDEEEPLGIRRAADMAVAEPVADEPKAKKPSRARKAAAVDEDGEEGEDGEMPDWKRRLLELTAEQEGK
jgi:DNA-directed RNA polymerase subunit alpha